MLFRSLDEQGCDRLLGPDKLGPDALAISENEFVERFQTLNRPIKPALLDQKLIAGIGNLYASEILHRAKVNPELRCNAVLGKSWSQIYYWMRSVLELAIDNQGSTLGDGTYRNAINGEGAFQHFHQVYARAGERCSVCKKGEIQRIVQAQRSTFFCPICQKKSKKLPRAK